MVSLCTPELTTMLGCWAAKNDLATTGACAESAKALFDCMRTTARLVHHLCFVSDHSFGVIADGWQAAPANDQLPPCTAEQGFKIILGEGTKLGMTTIDRGASFPCHILPEYKFTTCRLSRGPPATDVVLSPLILRTA